MAISARRVGDGGAVERVDEVRPLFALLLEADAQPPGLIVGAVAGAGDSRRIRRCLAPRPGIQASRSNLR